MRSKAAVKMCECWMCKHPLDNPYPPPCPSLPQVLPELLAGRKFVASPTTLPGPVSPAPAFAQGQPSLPTAFAAGEAEVRAVCSGTVKFLLPGLFWDVINIFHGREKKSLWKGVEGLKETKLKFGHKENFMDACG